MAQLRSSSRRSFLPKLFTFFLAPRTSSLPRFSSVAHNRSPRVGFPVATTMAKRTQGKMEADYASSGRSSCKSCGGGIPAGELRLGAAVARNGFTSMQWYHPSCFPKSSLSAAEDFSGFQSLKAGDQSIIWELVSKASTLADDGNKMDSNKKDDASTSTGGESSKKLKVSSEHKIADQKMPFCLTDVKNKYKDATLSHKWKAYKTVIFREQDEGCQNSAKIAAFDFDGCLAKTSVRRIGAEHWSLLYPSIPKKFQELYNSGYKLVIFTNESNIERWAKKRQEAVDSKVGRLDSFIECVQVPVQVFIACGLSNKGGGTDDLFRKPNPGMWRLMEEHFNSGIAVDMKKSFYVGDAAGRVGDHSDADIKFAEAVGLRFYVPEDYFCD